MSKERSQQPDKRNWETPPELFKRINDVFGFTLDVCAEPETAKCERFLSMEDNALKMEWGEEICWMNPPYGKPEQPCKPKCKKKRCKERGHHIDAYVPGIEDWCRKAYIESLKGSVVVGLLPASSGAGWYHRYVMMAEVIIQIEGRVKFLSNGEPMGSPDFDSILVVWPSMGRDSSKQFPILSSMPAYV